MARAAHESATDEDLALLGIETVSLRGVVDKLIGMGYAVTDTPAETVYDAVLRNEGVTASVWRTYGAIKVGISYGLVQLYPHISIKTRQCINDLPRSVAKQVEVAVEYVRKKSDIPRIADPLRDPKLDWLKSRK